MMESFIHERWIIPFKKFNMVRVNNLGSLWRKIGSLRIKDHCYCRTLHITAAHLSEWLTQYNMCINTKWLVFDISYDIMHLKILASLAIQKPKTLLCDLYQIPVCSRAAYRQVQEFTFWTFLSSVGDSFLATCTNSFNHDGENMPRTEFFIESFTLENIDCNVKLKSVKIYIIQTSLYRN